MTSPPCSQSEQFRDPSDIFGAEIRKRPRIDPVSHHKENHSTLLNHHETFNGKEESPIHHPQYAGVTYCARNARDDGGNDHSEEVNSDDDDSSVEFLYQRSADLDRTTIRNHDANKVNPSDKLLAQSTQPNTSIDSILGSDDSKSDPSTTSEQAADFAALDQSSPDEDIDMEDAMEPDLDMAPLLEMATSRKKASITPLTSAYLQNLAEICYTILFDQRWRVGTRNETLFQWERGDDLSVALALARRYIPTNQENERPSTWQCTCLLCKDKESDDVKDFPASPFAQAQPDTQQSAIPVPEEEEDDRCLHIYCRLFYRKGPWFRLDDIYKRYYTTAHRPSTSNTLEVAKIDEYLGALQLLIDDLKRLDEKGFLRGFDTEEECGKTVDETLLSNAERGQVLLRMAVGNKRGRGVPCPPGSTIWKQMKTQRPLFPGTRSSYLPVKQHVTAVMVRSLAHAVLRTSHPRHDLTSSELAKMEDRVKSIMSKCSFIRFVTGFCLREEPYKALARCARLYMCATSGPGSMRGDGTNGWRSLLTVPRPDPISSVRVPGIHAWHLADYPGLKYRFGLASYPFHGSFRLMPITIGLEGLTGERVFETHADFVALECSVELRAHVDFVLELDNVRGYNQRRVARGLQPLGQRNESSQEDRCVDFLNLQSPCGRRRIVCTMLQPFQRSDDDSFLSEIERDIEILGGPFRSECHNILFIVAIIAIHILRRRNATIRYDELDRRTRRPWLRHLWWDGNLAYVLWDIIPVLEKGNHFVAVVALETLLFGQVVSDETLAYIPHTGQANGLASILLSRRTRGKAFVRLFVDYRHLLKRARLPLKDCPADMESLQALQTESIRSFFHETVAQTITTASIPFSAIRELAKPLKRPLIHILEGLSSLEVAELGYRLHEVSLSSRADRYSEWNPKIDTAVANAMVNDENGPGSRCAYIGFDDTESPSALNVEQLAMEYYCLGRLHDERGGWLGFHDEGSHVHSLFRIICAGPILGSAWGCGLHSATKLSHSVHLSPYQGSPFHLLVGHVSESHHPCSFYHNQRSRIDAMMDRLARLTNQEVADLVHDSVDARRRYMETLSRSDPTTHDDASRLRTLSLIAAGLGGNALAAIFRCLCFDYRHFRGGMPDLTLVRASIHDDQGNAQTIPLGEWIGESFSVDAKNELQAQRASMIIGDEEFLGCSMGDSGGSSSFKRNRSSARPLNSPGGGNSTGVAIVAMPDRLVLQYDNRPVTVETMLVEVKSANDRLDPRQHDWLNVLDLHGNARVCKFEKNKTKKNNA